MRDLLNITYTGNLVRDAEVKELTKGNLTKLRTASNSGKDKDGKDKDAVFLDVDVWRQLGETCAGLKKGEKVGISGRLEAKVVEKDGKRMTYLSVVADSVSFLSKRQVEDSQPGSLGSSPAVQNLPISRDDKDEDLGSLF